MKVLDLFSGIGGFSLGLERAGMETIAFCEIEPFCRKVLKKHWPGVPIYEDVRELTNERLKADGITGIGCLTAGFPCQDISVAGKQKGIDGERSGLWSECARLLGDIRPDYAIFENVTALLSGDNGKWFERVLWDISQVGYDAEWHCIPASELGAHHHRDRVWIIAYSQSIRNTKFKQSFDREDAATQERAGIANQLYPAGRRRETTIPTNTNSEGFQERQIITSLAGKENEGNEGEAAPVCGWWLAEPNVGRVVNGIPGRTHRLKALGNSVVPQIPELIGRAIMETQ